MKNWRTISMIPNCTRLDPQPFAGDYPTRWRIEVNYGRNRMATRPSQVFHYVGKPNPLVARRVMQICTYSVCGTIYAVEFDRGGAFAFTRTHLPNRHILAADWAQVFRFYYPWIHSEGTLIEPWLSENGRVHRMPIIFHAKRGLIYHRNQQADMEASAWQTSWQEHKAWLERVSIQWGKFPSTSTR